MVPTQMKLEIEMTQNNTLRILLLAIAALFLIGLASSCGTTTPAKTEAAAPAPACADGEEWVPPRKNAAGEMQDGFCKKSSTGIRAKIENK